MARIFKVAEEQCIKLFEQCLGAKACRQYTGFEQLRGDPTAKRTYGVKLRVDAYFPGHKLVVEYLGRQHFKPNKLMNRRPGRRAQRLKYMERRRQVLPTLGIALVEVKYTDPLTKQMVEQKLAEAGIQKCTAD